MGKGALGALAAYWPEDTARYAHVPLKRVGDITIHALANAERVALVAGSTSLTYAEVSARVKRLAAALRARLAKGARVAISLADPVDLVTALFGCFECEMLAYASASPVDVATLDLFGADLVIGSAPPGAVGLEALLAGEGSDKPDRPDFKKPLLAFAKPDKSGEAVHNHKTLAATGVDLGSFFMIDGEARVLLLEPPTGWLALSMLIGTWHRGGAVWAGWGANPPEPERVDYVVVGWDEAMRRFVEGPPRISKLRIGAGAIVGIEGAFSLAKRRRLARRLGAPVLTMLGRDDLGPLIASHPSWFLDDAVGIPLPNVDTRPLHPTEGAPLNIGWDAVEYAGLGVKSAHAPAGATLVAENWIRCDLLAEIDPTGLYFLRA